MELNSIICPKCSGVKLWKTSDGRLKCKKCRYTFTPRPNPLNIQNEILEKIISEFILEHPIKVILERVNVSKYKLLKTLNFLRRSMANIEDNQREYAQTKQPVIGIICQNEKFIAKIVKDISINDLKFSFKKISVPESLKKYSGLVLKGSLYNLSQINEKIYRINALEGFWGYLKRKLSAKGGIRKKNLPFYLGEYSWRYNQRKLTLKEQEKYLLNLVFRPFKSYNR